MGEPSYSIESEQPLTLCLKIPCGSLKKNKDPSIWRTALTWTPETWVGSRVETTRLPCGGRVADAVLAPPMAERRAFALCKCRYEHALANDPVKARAIEWSTPTAFPTPRRPAVEAGDGGEVECPAALRRREHGRADAPRRKTSRPRRRNLGRPSPPSGARQACAQRGANDREVL